MAYWVIYMTSGIAIGWWLHGAAYNQAMGHHHQRLLQLMKAEHRPPMASEIDDSIQAVDDEMDTIRPWQRRLWWG